MAKVCPNKKERKQYEKVLKRMDKEAKECMKGFLLKLSGLQPNGLCSKTR